jgi:hypothetical protein
VPHGTFLWEGAANGERRCVIQFYNTRNPRGLRAAQRVAAAL